LSVIYTDPSRRVKPSRVSAHRVFMNGVYT
jgi:hypothetical protein